MPPGCDDHRQLARALLLGALNPPLDVANRVQVFDDPVAVAGAEAALQVGDGGGDRVEDAAVELEPLPAHRRIGRAAVAEQPFEDDARIVLHREQQRRRPPRDGVAERAALPVAVAGAVARIERELERRELRLFADLRGDQLIDRRSGDRRPFPP